MARKCGVCGKAPREGEEMRPMRLRTEEDLEASGAEELGLYSACLECLEEKRLRVFNANEEYVSIEQVPNKALM